MVPESIKKPFVSIFLGFNANLIRLKQEGPGSLYEEMVKGHSGAIYRGLQWHNSNNFGRGPLDNVIYQIWKLWAF